MSENIKNEIENQNEVVEITVTRTTRESEMYVRVNDGPRDPEAKKFLNTPLTFYNHMMEQIAWRAELNIYLEASLDHFALNHVICEDLGITFGKAIGEMMDKKQKMGAPGYGFSYGNIDESMARSVIGFEKRAYLDLDFGNIVVPESVEGINSEDLVSFLEGFVQGAQATLHIDLLKGRNNHGHHQWESIFRAFGDSLRQAMEVRQWRKNMAAGVAGEITWKIED